MDSVIRRLSHSLVLASLALLCNVPAHALLRLNDGRDNVYVTAYVGTGYDSNVFGRSSGQNGDLLISGGAGMEYARKAGLIGVNASVSWDMGNFTTFVAESFLNPSASLEFSKGTGRTTGSLQFNVKRESRADPTVGLRTDSWTYGVNLNYHYPVIERYSFAGNIGWDTVTYQGGGTTFSGVNTYTVGTDLFYTWRSDRDLLVGHRYRLSLEDAGSTSVDNSVYIGISGKIIRKLSGTARVGWTYRTTSYPAGIQDNTNDGMYVSLACTWPASHKATFTLAASQDFNTTSTNFETQTSSVDLAGRFSHTVKFSTNATLGAGYTSYISGYTSNSTNPTTGFNGLDRNDHYVTAGVGAAYVFNEHLTATCGYAYYQNGSNLPLFVFDRHTINLTLSTRW